MRKSLVKNKKEPLLLSNGLTIAKRFRDSDHSHIRCGVAEHEP